MGLFSSIKHGFEHLGHDIAHAAKDVGHGLETAGKDIAKVGAGVVKGVEQVGETLAKDVGSLAQHTIAATDDLIHGHMKAALNQAMQATQDLAKTATDVVTSGQQATVDSLAHMHLSKKLDKAMGKAEKGYDALKKDVSTSVGQVVTDVVKGTEGAVKDTIQAGKDAVHGHWGAALGDLGKAGMDAATVASDLTPEGAIAAVGTNMLANAHIGSQQLDAAIGGALHGNIAQTVKGVAKNVSEMEVSNKVEDKLGSLASKVMPEGAAGSGSGSSYAEVAAGAAIGIAGSGGFSGGSKRSHGSFEGGGGGSSKMKFSERLSAMTGRGASKGGPAEGQPMANGKAEGKKEKEQKQADNAQNGSSNTANQAGGDNGQLEQEEMLQLFMLQAGMNQRDDAKKRRAMLTGDA